MEFNPPATDRRVVELVNKTNQFNLNGIRYTEAEWQRSAAGSGLFRSRRELSGQVWAVRQDCGLARDSNGGATFESILGS